MNNLANLAHNVRVSQFLTTSRVLVYASASTAAVSAVVLHAFANHNNFYSATVYMSRSSRSALVLGNFAALMTFLAGRVMQQTFIGPLRPLEQERLYDRLWFFLTESLLAFTIFRDEFDFLFGVMFGTLLFFKCFHWLMSDRIEWMDQVPYPGPGILFQVRFLALFMVLSFVDLAMLAITAESIMMHGIGAIVLFGNEYAIMLANAGNCLAKFLVYTYDRRRAGRHGGENAPVWEEKSMYIFYIELMTDFVKLVTYLVFFLLILTFYGLPLNIIRDVYITARSFYQRCRDLARYLNATKNMDERYPDATTQELEEMSDKTCIICREELAPRDESTGGDSQVAQNQGPNMSPKKLLCGHIFHFHCLRSWLERQQSCPTCRRSVLETAGSNQTRPAQTPAPPDNNNNNNQAAPGQAPNRDAPRPTPTRAGNGASTSAQSPQQRQRRHRWANELPGFQAGPLQPALRFDGFNIGPGDWQAWGPLERAAEVQTSEDESRPESRLQEPVSTAKTEETSVTDPREAAASAALRRLGSGSGPGGSQLREASRRVAASVPSTPLLNRSPPSVDKGKSPATPLSEQRLASLTRAHELGIPPMIPLYDPSVYSLSSAPNLSPRVSQPSPPSTATPALSVDMIDERLRSLNDVQNALWNSAEELLKLKSLLPASALAFEHQSPPAPMPSEHSPLSDGPEGRRDTGSESYPSEDD